MFSVAGFYSKYIIIIIIIIILRYSIYEAAAIRLSYNNILDTNVICVQISRSLGISCHIPVSKYIGHDIFYKAGLL